MADNEKPEAGKTEYQRTARPGPGSPEYDAMDQMAKMFEKQVDELRGDRGAATESPPEIHP